MTQTLTIWTGYRSACPHFSYNTYRKGNGKTTCHAGQLLIYPDQKGLFPDQSQMINLCTLFSPGSLYCGQQPMKNLSGMEHHLFSPWLPGSNNFLSLLTWSQFTQWPGAKRYITTNEPLELRSSHFYTWIIHLRLFPQITQYSLKTKVSASHRHNFLCPLLENCRWIM